MSTDQLTAPPAPTTQATQPAYTHSCSRCGLMFSPAGEHEIEALARAHCEYYDEDNDNDNGDGNPPTRAWLTHNVVALIKRPDPANRPVFGDLRTIQLLKQAKKAKKR